MKTQLLAVGIVAGVAGCSSNYVPPPPSTDPGPAYRTEFRDGRPGLFGDLTWTINTTSGERTQSAASPAVTGAAAVSAAEQEEFKKWRESAGQSERQEFDDWRAWQEWKRKNPGQSPK